MVYDKNYETMFKFVKVMPKIPGIQTIFPDTAHDIATYVGLGTVISENAST